jgi:predicted anti-sigma-YlaC factor YlaD
MLSLVPPNDCLRARESISARLDGELSELGAARLAAHLRGCPECSAYASGVGTVARLLRDAPLEQPSIDVTLPSRRRLPGLRVAAAAAAVVAIAASSSFVLGRTLGTGTSTPASTRLTGAADLLSLRADSKEQHLAMLWRSKRIATPNYGRAIAI